MIVRKIRNTQSYEAEAKVRTDKHGETAIERQAPIHTKTIVLLPTNLPSIHLTHSA